LENKLVTTNENTYLERNMKKNSLGNYLIIVVLPSSILKWNVKLKKDVSPIVFTKGCGLERTICTLDYLALSGNYVFLLLFGNAYCAKEKQW